MASSGNQKLGIKAVTALVFFLLHVAEYSKTCKEKIYKCLCFARVNSPFVAIELIRLRTVAAPSLLAKEESLLRPGFPDGVINGHG